MQPRPDQIAELTRGLQLPLEGLPEVHLRFIADALHNAFHELKALYPTVASGSEDEVTALLETKLNNMVGDDQRWGTLVRSVSRGREALSFDGTHLKKEPDLSIYLTIQRPNFPLIVEAKLIDAPTSKTEKKYCDNGIRRFVDGEYAWGNREAFMLAYVRDGSTISGLLTPFLASGTSWPPGSYLTASLPLGLSTAGMDLARSQHGRPFRYLHRTAPDDQPGDISLWHLWLT